MEKEKYEELQMEVIEIESVDVITESNPNSDTLEHFYLPKRKPCLL